jgi:hypothetical protein
MKVEQDNWDNEGGHVSSATGRVARTLDAELPYTVLLTHDGGDVTERAFATMREAEAFIRRNTPRPPVPRRTLYDRAAEEGPGSKFPREVSP